jgi:hypothetical protein
MARPTKNGQVPKATLWAIRLKKIGFKSLSHWARVNNFPVDTVVTCVQRWGDRSDMPLGGIARNIMTQLRKDAKISSGKLIPVEDVNVL